LKWCLSGCRYASLAFPLTGVLYRWWSEQIEMVCDEVAARQTKAPIDVAGALVRLRRLTLVAPDRNIVSVESGFFGDSTEVLERRVRRLLSLTDEHERRGALVVRSWLRCATALSAFFAFTLLGVFATSPLSIHRLIEALLHPF
jgi:hypothetical protein